MPPKVDARWEPYRQRIAQSRWRSPVFRDMILDDVAMLHQQRGGLTLLDIGCGRGFDDDTNLQRSLAQAAAHYIGIEPDSDMQLGDIFSNSYRCSFEDAPIEPESVDIAFAVMVLEHIKEPRFFWEKVHKVLKKGGVFWGFTIDARNWFVAASLLTERLKVKDVYLDLLHGKRGEGHYFNYGIYYRSNTPRQITALTPMFSERSFLNYNGELTFYFPKKLRWLSRLLFRLEIGMGLPGSNLIVRLEK